MLTLAKQTLDVGLVPHDVDAMRSFYRDVLGLPAAEPRPLPGGTLVPHTLGTSVVKLFCTDRTPPKGDGGMAGGIGYRLLTMILPDLPGVVARARAAGTAVDESTFDAGGTQVPLAFLPDPDGNLLELVGVPGAPPSLQVGLTVTDVDRTTAFFRDVLGLAEDPVLQYGDIERHSVQFGQTTVKFWTRPGDLPRNTGPIADFAGIRYITAWVRDLEKVVEQLDAAGCQLPMPLTDLGAARIAFVADPDGNWIELVETA